MKKIFLSALMVLMVLGMYAQSSILGIWYNTTKSAKVEIFKKGANYYGKIVWLEEPNSKNTRIAKVDQNNPEVANQKKPILGLIILENFSSDGSGQFSGGTIYDPENGKTYKCKMTLTDKNKLDVRGYLGIPVLGRTENWTRAIK